MSSYDYLEAVMKEALLMSPTKYVEDETQTIFLYDPETNSDLVGSGMVINLVNGTTQSPELVNGHPSIQLLVLPMYKVFSKNHSICRIQTGR